MKVEVICNYCGFREEKYLYSKKDLKCTSCKDSNLKFREYDDESRDVFGYNQDKAKEDAYIKNNGNGD